MPRYLWARWGDVNAFFGLILDNIAVMIWLVALVTADDPVGKGCFSREFVLTQMIPGTALGVMLGDLVYTWMAFRLAQKSGRTDVTAMPLGLDTPSTIAVGTLVLVPALNIGLKKYELDHAAAMVFGWHVAAMVLVMSGLFKTLFAPFGSYIRKIIPRAGLLGSLAGIALALIAFVPLWQNIATVPLVGMASLTVILLALVAHRALPGHFPGALAATILGVGLYAAGQALGKQTGIPFVPAIEHGSAVVWRLPNFLPAVACNAQWWQHVFATALTYLPIMLPFALATIVGGIDCTESAAAAGDEYDTRSILLTEGVASIVAGLLGGVIQTTPYIGQPAYKKMGGRAAYTLAAALFIALAGCLGWFARLFEWLPEAAAFPLLVFVGLEIGSQAFRATDPRHYAAVGLAILPALAYMALIPLDMALAGRPPADFAEATVMALRCLANGFILTSVLWASAMSAILDRHLVRAALFLLAAAVASLFGLIHSPLVPAAIGLPNYVYARIPSRPELQCQSPYHWAGAYVISAAVLLAVGALTKVEPEEVGLRIGD